MEARGERGEGTRFTIPSGFLSENRCWEDLESGISSRKKGLAVWKRFWGDKGQWKEPPCVLFHQRRRLLDRELEVEAEEKKEKGVTVGSRTVRMWPIIGKESRAIVGRLRQFPDHFQRSLSFESAEVDLSFLSVCQRSCPSATRHSMRAIFVGWSHFAGWAILSFSHSECDSLFPVELSLRWITDWSE